MNNVMRTSLTGGFWGFSLPKRKANCGVKVREFDALGCYLLAKCELRVDWRAFEQAN